MKKIVIFIVTVLVLGVVAMYSCVVNSKRIEQEKTKSIAVETEEIQQEENNNTDSNTINDTNNENEQIIQKEQKQEIAIKENKSNTAIKTTKNKEENTKQEKSTTQRTQVASDSKNDNKAKTENVYNESKKEKNEKVEVTNEEKRVRNDKMIETMRNVIKNNETEDMKNFGYEIVVDSSITSRTNYFTYTEKRLTSKLLYRFGTIRIYAEDLYVNGGYAHTECFIY